MRGQSLREKRAATAAASSPQAEALDETQTSFADGPCLTAIREHTIIRVGDTRDDNRWPEYHAIASKEGVRSVLGIPFELGEEGFAGVNSYSPTPNDFGPEKVELLEHEVRQASNALRLAVRMARLRETEKDLHAAMESRTVIDLAVGIVMAQNRCAQQEAVAILKAASSHRNVKLRELAAELVTKLDPAEPNTHFDA
ncbi:GAF and ANTAR domain-containing protein [Brachybacterium sp. GCM10030267]|uniref:GAF and ANTAR domain-containing protein n=1 Tax=Brachybacterium sp. GCM10030267 TaxID=3273381 RepID=UPI00361F4698